MLHRGVEGPVIARGESVVDLICRDCDFFREDERDLECSALALLKRLLAKKIIGLEDILRAVKD